MPRYRMLETVREFGLEQLEASGEANGVMSGCAAWALALAAQGTSRCSVLLPLLVGAMRHELDNLRAVLSWGARAEGRSNRAGPLSPIWVGSGMSAGV